MFPRSLEGGTYVYQLLRVEHMFTRSLEGGTYVYQLLKSGASYVSPLPIDFLSTQLIFIYIIFSFSCR